MLLTPAILRKLWPKGDEKIPGLIDGICASSMQVFELYGINTPLLVCHVMAQISHECGAGHDVVENLNYTSAARIVAVWPKRFTEASALPYVRNPRKLANKVYNGRMGNRVGSDDGWNNRGRGACQTTGHDGYDALTKAVGLDLVGEPDLINYPEHFLKCGVADFVIICKCLPFAKKNDIAGVTLHLNGGYTGLNERKAWFTRWQDALAEAGHDTEIPELDDDGFLRYGDKNEEVRAFQTMLIGLGYALGVADGKFGAATRAAVLAFQADNDLTTDGVIGEKTRIALRRAPPRPVAEERETATEVELRDLGSKTVASADAVGTVSKVLITAAAAGGASQTGALDSVTASVTTVTGQVTALKPVLDGAKGAWDYVASAWWIALIVIGFLLLYYGRDIVKQRLADHRSGKNMAR